MLCSATVVQLHSVLSSMSSSLHDMQDQQELYKEFGFTSLPGPLAEVVVRVSHLKLTLPSIKDQTVAVSEFAEMSLSAYAKLHTVGRSAVCTVPSSNSRREEVSVHTIYCMLLGLHLCRLTSA